jgi:hypothetical protein
MVGGSAAGDLCSLRNGDVSPVPGSGMKKLGEPAVVRFTSSIEHLSMALPSQVNQIAMASNQVCSLMLVARFN